MKIHMRYFKVINDISQEMMHISTYIWLLQWFNLQSRTKVRAQRKFAMNQPNNVVSTNQTNTSTSVPCTETGVTSTSKTGEKTSSTIVFPKRAKTEDFLTFLCLRGTRCQSDLINFLVQYTCIYLSLKTWEKCTIGVNKMNENIPVLQKACKLIIYSRKLILNLNNKCRQQLGYKRIMVGRK